jgi:hypothetical protein
LPPKRWPKCVNAVAVGGIKTAARSANVCDSRFLPLAIFAFNVDGVVLRLGRAIAGRKRLPTFSGVRRSIAEWGAVVPAMADVRVGDGR